MPTTAAISWSDAPAQWPRPADLGSIALLLDVDGTILDIATTPAGVIVPEPLRDTLQELHRRTGGAVALVSGRRIGNLDRLFAPLRLPAIGGHGAEMRLAGDRPALEHTGGEIGAAVRREVEMMAAADDPRVIVEDKGSSLAVHYRLVPHREHALKQAVAAILDRYAANRLEAINGKAVIEIKPKGYNKGTAVVELMKIPPFADRLPVFVGDDTTDETVFAVLPGLGGRGYSVERVVAGMSGMFGSPREVRCWLRRLWAEDEIFPQ